LRNTEGSTADDAGDVRAVPVAVDTDNTFTPERVVDGGGTPVKFEVRGENAGIDDISVHALTVVGIRITVIERQIALVNAIESPRVGPGVRLTIRTDGHNNRRRVGRPHRDGAILYNERYLRVTAHRDRLRLASAQEEALESRAPGGGERAAVSSRQLRGRR